jgi:hypothetical protein
MGRELPCFFSMGEGENGFGLWNKQGKETIK